MAAQAFTALVGGDAAAAGSMSLFTRIAPLDRAEATICPMPGRANAEVAIMLWTRFGPPAVACLLPIRRSRTETLAIEAIAFLGMLATARLSLAAWRAVHHFRAYQGPVAFVGMVAAAGLPLILRFSRWPRTGLLVGLGSSTIATGAIALGFTR